MKISKAILSGLLTLFLVLSVSQALASRPGYLSKPKLSISEALRIAEDHLAAQKVDVLSHFVFSASLHISGVPHDLFQTEDKDAWVVTWVPFAPSRYANHYVVVCMDKSVSFSVQDEADPSQLL